MSFGNSISHQIPVLERMGRVLSRASRPLVIVALAGINLTLIQFAAMRDFAPLLGSNELVLLVIVAGYFVGLSAGYLVSDRLGYRVLVALGVLTLALHASLPFSARWFAGTMATMGFGGSILPFVFVLMVFGITPFYAIWVPRLVSEARSGTEGGDGSALTRLYAAEIAGGCLGLLIVLIVTPARIAMILAIHLTGLIALVLFFARPRRAALALFALPLLYFATWSSLDRWSLEYYYRHVHSYDDATVIVSELSPYQRIDIIDVPGKTRATTYLYLNGNLLYGTRSLHMHNLMLSILPNLVARRAPTRALVIGGGSLDSARYLAPRVRSLDVVEIDEAVTRLARKHIQEPRGNFPTNWRLTIDDAKHFLGNSKGEPFDVISVDIPIPTHFQTAMLYSDRFFELSHSRLKSDGIFSISFASALQPRPPTVSDLTFPDLANRIAAGLLHNFKHVIAVRVGDNYFAWASDELHGLPGSAAEVQARMDKFLDEEPGRREILGSPRIALLDEMTVERCAKGFSPIGEADAQIVLRLSLTQLYYRFYAGKPR